VVKEASILNAERAQEVIDGAMLSDAGVYFAHGGGPNENAYFELGLSGWHHDDWLKQVYNTIKVLGAESSLNDITYRTKLGSNGRTYEDCRLKTKTHSLFTLTRGRWYQSNIKIVPKDLLMTPLLLTHWFAGDGDSVWGASGLLNLVEARFGTYCFTEEEVTHLRKLLEVFKINTSLEKRKGIIHGDGLRIRVRNSTAVNQMMDLVEPFIPLSYQYKIKRPWLKKRGPKAGKSYIRCWVPNCGWRVQEA